MAATQFLPLSVVNKNLQSFVRYATRVVADGVLNTTTTVTSATAAFTSADVGAAISGTGIPANATIASVTNATTVVISAAATATASGVTLTITQTAALGVPVLATALNAAFGTQAGLVQCWVDSTTGQTTQAVVDANNQSVFSVPVGNYVSYFNGVWQQQSPAQMAANWQQFFLT